MIRRVVALTTIASVGAALVPLAASGAMKGSRSTGFSADAGEIRCAVRLAEAPGLLCAAASVRASQYDHRGIIRLSSSGKTSILRSGSDLLLAIDGNRDHTARPRLVAGRPWQVAGYSCVLHARTVTCRRSGHGFSISPSRLSRF